MVNKPDITNFRNCIVDAKRSFFDDDRGPEDPTDYNQLRSRLRVYPKIR